MEQHTILEEAKNLIALIEDYRGKLERISRENALMRGLLIEKNRTALKQKEKNEELVRLLVLADKMLSEMKEKIYSREEKASRLSEKINNFADIQNKSFEEMKKILLIRNEQMKMLISERSDYHKKIAALASAYSKTRGQLSELSHKLREAETKMDSNEDKKAIEDIMLALKKKGR